MNAKIKHFVKKNSKIYKALYGIFRYIFFLDNNAAYVHYFKRNKTTIRHAKDNDEVCRLINSSLFPQSAQFVIDQYTLVKSAKYVVIPAPISSSQTDEGLDDEEYGDPSIPDDLESNEELVLTDAQSALTDSTTYLIDDSINGGWAKVEGFAGDTPSCSFHHYTGMVLPCSHIFSLRLEHEISPFVKSMIPARWSTNFSLETAAATLTPSASTDEDQDDISSSQGSTISLPSTDRS